MQKNTETTSEDIQLIFEMGNQEKEIINCNRRDKLKNLFDVYCRIKRIEKDSIYLLYNGKIIENFEVTLDELVDRQIISDNTIIILVYHKLNSVFIVFSHLAHSYKVKKDIEEKLETVYSEYLSKK